MQNRALAHLVASKLCLESLQGFGVLSVVALLYGLLFAWDRPELEARAMGFTAVVLGNIGLILSNRSRHEVVAATLRRPNLVLWWIVVGAIIGLVLALYVEPVAGIFRFAPLSWSQLLTSIAAAAAGLIWPELYKSLHRCGRRQAGRAPCGWP